VTDPAVAAPDAASARRRTRLGGYALVLDEADRILLCRLSTVGVEPGRWMIPGGGVDFAEHPDTTVLRELREETGLSGEILGIAGVFSQFYPNSPFSDGADLHFLGILYIVRIVGGELTDEVDGTTDQCAWFGRDEIRDVPLVGLARFAVDLIWPGALS
jgi:8-oxo-dGTP diphosphatase